MSVAVERFGQVMSGSPFGCTHSSGSRAVQERAVEVPGERHSLFLASRQPRKRDCEARFRTEAADPALRWAAFATARRGRGRGVVQDAVGRENATDGLVGRVGGGRQAPRTKVPQTGSPVLGYSGMRHRSAATASVERLDKRTLPVRRPDHHTAPAPLSACRAENTRVAAQAQNRLRRARKHEETHE